MNLNKFQKQKRKEIADALDKLGKNEAWISIKDKGGDAIAEALIKVGISAAEGMFNMDVPQNEQSEKFVDSIADKGGNFLVKGFNGLVGLFKKILRWRTGG